MSKVEQPLPLNETLRSKWLELVVQKANSLRYGSIKIIIIDSRVIQIEKMERVRLDRG
ncbi:MAG: YezD family protein [Verrucomicrobiota bacterium]|jgi:hypothetical protein